MVSYFISIAVLYVKICQPFYKALAFHEGDLPDDFSHNSS
jgi:hypothetical protein